MADDNAQLAVAVVLDDGTAEHLMWGSCQCDEIDHPEYGHGIPIVDGRCVQCGEAIHDAELCPCDRCRFYRYQHMLPHVDLDVDIDAVGNPSTEALAEAQTGSGFRSLSIRPHPPIPEPLGQWVPGLVCVWLSAAAGAWTLVHSAPGNGKSEQVKGWCARFEQIGVRTSVVASERWSQWQTRIQQSPEYQISYAPSKNRPSLDDLAHDWTMIREVGLPEPQVIVFDVWHDMLAGWLEAAGRHDREYIVSATRWGIEQVESIVGEDRMVVLVAHHPEGQDRPVGGVLNNAAMAYTIDEDRNLRITKVSEQEEHLTVGDTTIWIKDHEQGILVPTTSSHQPIAASDIGGLEKRVRNIIRAQPCISVRKITDTLPSGIGVKKTTGILDRLYQAGDIHYHETKPIRADTRPGQVWHPGPECDECSGQATMIPVHDPETKS